MTSRRRTPTDRTGPRRELLVHVEGARTEDAYLVFWHRMHRDSVTVTIPDFRGGPLQLVQAAVAARRTAKADERRGKGRAFDEYWCVFDIDIHPHIPEALDLAAANDIALAISNPCLELWFLIHFRDQTAHIERHDAQHESARHLACDKRLTPLALEALATRYDDAKRRAIALDEWHDGNGSNPGANPSSGMWRLIDSIKP